MRVGVTAGFQPLDYGLVMNHFDHVLLMDEASWPVLVPDLCIMLGDHLTSKRIGRFIEYCALASHGRCVLHISCYQCLVEPCISFVSVFAWLSHVGGVIFLFCCSTIPIVLPGGTFTRISHTQACDTHHSRWTHNTAHRPQSRAGGAPADVAAFASCCPTGCQPRCWGCWGGAAVL